MTSLKRLCQFCAGVAVVVGAAAPSTLSAQSPDVPPCGLYLYRADITRVIDGDTVVADIDLGFNTWRRDERLRLARIDAPEKDVEPKAAAEATKALRDLVEGRQLYICTIKARRSDNETRGSFGRYLVEVHVGGDHRNVNDWMIERGFAKPYR
ncbi:MAG: thermonuclease family protein [Pseudomonadota bacterium]